MTAEPDHRATTASVDRRVERLELAQVETNRKVDEISVSVGFLKELMTLKFQSLEATVLASNSRTDAFIARMEAMVEKAQTQAGDLRANPLGRQVDDRLTKMESKTEAYDDLFQQFKGAGFMIKVYIIPAAALALSALAWIASAYLKL